MIKGIIFVTAFLLMLQVPALVNLGINALPQPLPQIIGVLMFVVLMASFIAVLNKLMKGDN